MGSKTITVCSCFLIFVFVMSVFAFSASQNNGFFAFADTGDITDPILASEEFDTDEADDPDIVHVSGDVFAIVYDGFETGAACEGCLKTVRISSDGTITLIATFEFDDDEADDA